MSLMLIAVRLEVKASSYSVQGTTYSKHRAKFRVQAYRVQHSVSGVQRKEQKVRGTMSSQ